MPIDKTWTTIENRNSDEFSRGLESFVERSEAHVDRRGLIRCPCRKCVNSDFVKISVMKAHIERFGFSRRYITWVYHGETIAPPIVDDVAPRNEMAGVIEDVMGENEPAIFEKVLGSRRGHIKGIGHKPSARTNSSAYSEGHSHTSPHTHVQPELDVEAILSNPAFRAGIVEIFQSLTSQNDSGGLENRRNERDERDEENDDNNGDE